MSETTMQVGMGQLAVEGGRLSANLDRARRMIQDAASQGCQIVVLPECLDVGWTHSSAKRLAEPIPGASSDALSRAAIEAGIHVVAGLTERDGDRIYNAAVLIDPNGEILLVHRKINVLEIAQDVYAVGDRLSVARTPLGTIGVNICADNFPDSLCLGHALARMGAQMLLSPCAWAVDADHDPIRAPYGQLWRTAYGTLAPVYEMPIVGVSNVGRITDGPWKGRKCIGCSLAIGGDGSILAEAPYGEAAECLTVVRIKPRTLGVQGTELAPMLRHK